MLGFRGSWLLDDFRDLEEPLASGDKASTDRAVEGQLAFMRGLHGGHAAILGGGSLDELLGATLLRSAQVKMIAYEQQERRFAGELASAKHRMAVAERRGLLDEPEALGVRSGDDDLRAGVAGDAERQR